MTRSPLRALAGALLAAAVTGTLLTSAITSPADAATPRPAVGDCHSLTVDEYNDVSDPDPRISCERAHTSRTIAVRDLPASSFRDDRSMFVAGLRVCSPALKRALGSSASQQALSAYDSGFFFPSKAQVQAGARWVRCDIVLLGGSRLLALPTDREPALGSAPLRSNVARCAQVSENSRVTACSVKHNYRAKGTVAVSGSGYPARSRFVRIAEERCARIAGTRNWYATWPGQYEWVYEKERQLVCFAYSRR